MDDRPHAPAFNVYLVELCGIIPLTRYYSCVHCEYDLTDWITKQSPGESSACPNCDVRIDESDIAQAQHHDKFIYLWMLAKIAGLILAMAAAAGFIWLFVGPGRLIQF